MNQTYLWTIYGITAPHHNLPNNNYTILIVQDMVKANSINDQFLCIKTSPAAYSVQKVFNSLSQPRWEEWWSLKHCVEKFSFLHSGLCRLQSIISQHLTSQHHLPVDSPMDGPSSLKTVKNTVFGLRIEYLQWYKCTCMSIISMLMRQ